MKRLLLLLLALFMLAAPASAATEMVTNGNFAQDGYGWTETLSPSGGTAYITYSSSDLITQDLAVYFTAVSGRDYVYASLKQSVDLTDVPTLTFKVIDIDFESYSNWGGFVVKIDNTDVWERDVNNLPTNWQEYSVDVSGYTGTHTITFMLYMDSVSSTASHSFKVGLTDVSAINLGTMPTLNSATLSPEVIEVGNPVTLSIDFTPGYPTQTEIGANFGSGSGYQSRLESTSPQTFTHTYSSTGTYDVKLMLLNDYGGYYEQSIGSVEVISLDFTASATSGSTPLTVQFFPDAVGFVSYQWNFGDGTTSYDTQPIHTYTTAGVYSVTLTGTTSSGNTYFETKTDYINTNPQSISFNKTQYIEGDDALISWQLRSPDYSTYQYTLQILPSDSLGNPTGQSIITPVTLSGTSGTYEWSTDNLAGYFTAVIIRSGGQSPETIVATTANVISTATLTVNLAVSGVTYTNTTTITLTSNGQIVATETTSTGQAQFTVPTGVYTVSATTTGYATQTANVNLISATSIIIDFVTGASEGSTPSGAGQAYASTFITFRVQDSGTGKYLSGVTVNAIGVEPTNPIEWMGNLFGGYWGENIMETQLSGVTDETGTVTFAMFPNVRYRLDITYNSYTESRSFQASTLTGEYLISLPITQTNRPTVSQKITTTVQTTEDKQIVATYNDATQTTSTVVMTLYQVVDGNRTQIASNPATSWNYSQTFSPSSPSGNSYILEIVAQTGEYGEVVREYGIDFPGPQIKIGNLPDGAYVVISFLILVLLGAAGTYITSRMFALVIVIVGIVLWWAGWLFALGPAGGIALTICFILAIAYYIATGGQPQ